MASKENPLYIPKPGQCKRKRRTGKHTKSNATKERRKLEVRCRELTAILVKHRDNYTCQKCFRTQAQGYKIDAAHIRPKGKYSLMQFMLDNIIALCFSCHDGWWHKCSEGLPWFQATYPDRWLRIQMAERMPRRVDFKELLIALESEVAQLGCGAERGAEAGQ